ncbi:pectate lyase superfamily protein [Vibrio phage 1.264.O._10N.286.51.F2]|nr:pectate lyase superfamily protein [Vibrio phage 1.264.O._10N.286.51.F2]
MTTKVNNRMIDGAPVNVLDFGAVGDGVTDDTDALIAALAAGTTVEFGQNKTYLIRTGANILTPNSNTVLNFNGSTVKAMPSNLDSYHMFALEEVENITFNNGFIEGERDEHTGTTGEQGFCIAIRGAKDVVFNSMSLSKSWGDNIYIGIGPTVKYASNITMNACVLDRARRNGLSVVSVDGLAMNSCTISNTAGTAPEFGIDFEPNNNDERLRNISITNLRTVNNANSAVGFAIDKLDGGSTPVSISIDNYQDYGSLFALGFNLALNTKGYIKIRNVLADSQIKNSITFKNWEVTAPQVDIDGVTSTVNHSRTTDIIGDTPVSFQMPNGNIGGNINIKNVEQYFTSGQSGTGYNVAFDGSTEFRTLSLDGIEGQILNQQALSEGSKIIDDEFLGVTNVLDFPFVTQKFVNLKNTTAYGNTQLQLQAFRDTDTVYQMTCVSETGSDALTINPPGGESLYPLGIDDLDSGKITLNELGKSILIKRQGGRWVVTSKNY